MNIETIEQKQTEVELPFCGYYESVLSDMIDSEMDHIIEYMNEDNNVNLEYDDFEFTIDFDSINKAYVDNYKYWLQNEYDILVGMEYMEMISPREYNFTTDRIFVKVKDSDLKLLFDKNIEVNGVNGLQESINSRFKSRSGFMSFYDDFCDDWQEKPLSEWDHNELSILFINPDVMDVYEDMHEDIANSISYSLKTDKE